MKDMPLSKTNNKPWLGLALLVVLFVAALGIRLFDLNDLPNDFYMVRQYRSLIIARGMYYEHLASAPEWQRDMAVSQWKSEDLIEPPIMESLVALTYKLTGVRIWLGRLYASLFWLAGGVAIFLLSREMTMQKGGMIALAYYLFAPFALTVSHAFLPDPLMVAMVAWSIWALYRWDKRRTWMSAILAGILTGISILVKSVAVFPLLGAAAGLVISRASWKRIFIDKQTWAVIGITVVPSLIYYIYGITTTNLASQFSFRFFPAYWKDQSFYVRWLYLAAGFSGFSAMLAALVGILFFPSSRQRLIAIGLWVGYIAYGITFPYHFMTHDYYHLPIILVVAFGLIPVMDAVVRHVVDMKSRLTGFAFIGILALGLAMQMWQMRNYLAASNYEDDIAFYQDLGKIIGHDKKVIEISGDYGYRLAYWGWVSGTNWSTVSDINLRTMAGQAPQDFSPESFSESTSGMDLFVITSLGELDNQPQLRDYLAENIPVFSQGDYYLIYNLKP